MKKKLISLGTFLALLSGQLLASEAPEKVSSSYARSLFMSTAGSVIQYDKNKETKKKVSTAKPSMKYASKNNFTTGMQIQVLRLAGDNILKPVNPYSYVFKEGDKFKVRVRVNLPGVVMFYNVDPKGNENYLGAWPIEKAFSTVEIPYEGSFEFYGVKGEDKLYVIFKPCQVNPEIVSTFEKKTSYSRSIRLVDSASTQKVQLKEEVHTYLPTCVADINYYSEENIKKEKTQFINYSRSIRFVSDEKESLYAFSSNNKEKMTTSKGGVGDIIVSVLTFKFK
ncbi:MAG: hypothetical protein ABWJ99_02990 [Caldimicrobium sp.]